MKKLVLCLLLAGCASAPSPEYMQAKAGCNQETLGAMRSGLSDNAAGAVYQSCMAEHGFTR